MKYNECEIDGKKYKFICHVIDLVKAFDFVWELENQFVKLLIDVFVDF